jgi:hypothetical protein
MDCYGWPEHEYQALDTRNQKGYNTVYYTHMVASYKKQELLTFHNHRGSPPVLSGEPIAYIFCFLSYAMVFVLLRIFEEEKITFIPINPLLKLRVEKQQTSYFCKHGLIK